MRRRWLLLLVAVGLLAAGAGCMGTSTVSDQQLAQNATYDWNATAAQNASVVVNATGGQYQAVVNVTGANASSLRFSQQSQFTGESPVAIRAVQFRYSNGTVVNASAIDVSQSRDAVTVTTPAENGTFAYTAPMGDRSLDVPVVLSGHAHEVVLPAGMRVRIPVFGSVSPGGYERTIVHDRVHLHWNSVDAEALSVQFFLMRDVYLFGGLLGLAALVAVVGLIYYRLQIRRLERERAESGLDVRDD
ncbi:hypothetical protein MBEHAL_1960 [Halarchaeum acidiphilum MH1-52-1]|uniref:Lipoprotein n=1 Tax=Halarchaeum acidiphilum MH1-52-1 TaxID=1261545 RepID=U2YVZ5_9EURY|nr:DUF5803 family protein [Halarchaeum acidiphilum]GAD53200.1 hypothetical protein MBEHAL_1960 [Halarchaeum acidiphilum MH1-52-1]